MSATASEHWMNAVARGAGLPDAEALTIPPRSTTTEAWARAGEAWGLPPEGVAERVAGHFGLQVADLERSTPSVLKLLPVKVARRHAVFPLRMDDGQFVVATADPTSDDAERDVAFASGRTTIFEVATPQAVSAAIVAAYGLDPSETSEELTDEVSRAVEVVEDLGPEKLDAQDVDAPPVVRLTNIILRDAVFGRASDIHFEAGRKECQVRLRVDGVMRTHMRLPPRAMNRVVSRIKVMAKLDIADRLRPQDGRARIVLEGRAVDLRVSTVPTRDAEKAVVRILAQSGSQCLADVGLSPHDLERFGGLIRHRDGIVIVTGPTGSGKTTTLYAAIREIANGEVNVMTVEDPVEYELPAVTQIQVETKRRVTFASALRAVLRQDPDVILVGEIRDLETAEVALHASMTGHLVLTTLHTNDAVSAVARLLDLGVDRSGIASALRGVVAQRLARRVCPKCAVDLATVEWTPAERKLADGYGVTPHVRAAGCARCGTSGYEGRLPLNEVLVMNGELAGMISRGATAAEMLRGAMDAGMRPISHSARDRVEAGETTLEEIERVLGERMNAGAAPGPTVAPPAAERPIPSIAPALTAPRPVPDGAAASAAVADGAEAGILVVDDDAVHRKIACRALESHGFRVLEASGGAAALEILAGGAPCALVITDLHMPGLGGRELLSCLRAMPGTSTLPIVITTSEADEAIEIQLIEAGADDYIRKPVDPSRLLARVRATLRRAAA